MKKVIGSLLTLTVITSMFLGASEEIIRRGSLLNAGARLSAPTSPVFENITPEELETIEEMKASLEKKQEDTVKVRIDGDEETVESDIHEKALYIVAGEPLEYHHVYEIDPFNNLLSIEDGSIWKIQSNEMSDVYDWVISDNIIIEQNSSFFDLLFSGYPYVMKNLNLVHFDGSYDSVHADIKTQPWAFDVDSFWIYDMSSFWGSITLCDGTKWTTYDSISYWDLDDHIIIGRNSDSSTRASYPYILINTRLNTHARARLN